MITENDVREKSFAGKTKIRYDESCARFILEGVFPDRYVDLQIDDRPDLQSKDGQYGIEVTNAMPEDYQKMMNLIGAINTLPDNKAERYKKGWDKNHYILEPRSWAEHYTDKELAPNHSAHHILNAVDKKVQKLNSKTSAYKPFICYELFVLHDMPCLTGCRPLVFSLMKAINCNDRTYSRIYVFSAGELNVFDFSANQAHVILETDIPAFSFQKCLNDAWNYVVSEQQKE